MITNFLLREGVDNLFHAQFKEEKADSTEEVRRRERFLPGSGGQHAIQEARREADTKETVEILHPIEIPLSLDPQLTQLLKALQEHITSLENRVTELDGRNVFLQKNVLAKKLGLGF